MNIIKTMLCRKNQLRLFVIGVAVLVIFVMPSSTNAQNDEINILAGQDSFVAADAGFNLQLPPDFFGPGSEPFGGVVLCGPGDTDQNTDATDTIVERKSDINLPPDGTDTIPIELVQLNLVSCQPIVVSFNDGTRQQWDVEVGLPPTPQPTGQMTIRRSGNEHGGTFDALLPVQPLFQFTPIEGTITLPGDDEGRFGESSKPADADALIFDAANFLFVVQDIPWRVCADMQRVCMEPWNLADDTSFLDLVPLPPLPEPTNPSEPGNKIRQAADKIASSNAPEAQELANILRVQAELIDTLMEEIDNLPVGPPDDSLPFLPPLHGQQSNNRSLSR